MFVGLNRKEGTNARLVAKFVTFRGAQLVQYAALIEEHTPSGRIAHGRLARMNAAAQITFLAHDGPRLVAQ